MMKKWRLLIPALMFTMCFGITAAAKSSEDTVVAFGAVVDEMITTGEIASGENSEEIEELIAFIKAKMAAGELTTNQDILEAVKEGEEKFNVSLTDEDKDKILSVMHKIKELGLDPEKLLDPAKDLYNKFGDELINNAEEVIKESFKESVSNFFTDMGSAVKNFFTNIFS